MSARRRRLMIVAQAGTESHDLHPRAIPDDVPAPAKPKSSPTPPPKPAAAPPRSRQLATRFFRPKWLIALAAIVSAAVFLPRMRSALPDLEQRSEYRLSTSQIEINEPPRWVPADLVEQVIQQAGLPDSVSVLESRLTADVAEAFRRHPWIADVVSVRKAVPARVIVEVRYRRPAAMVEVPQGMYPVDAAGILLPPADFSIAESRRYPAIQNVRSTPQGPAGTKWGDLQVEAAAQLAAELLKPADGLEPRWRDFRLSAIQISPDGQSRSKWDDIVLELMTAGGSRIVWGRPPGSTHPGELSTDQKLGRLDKYRADFGGFDHPHGPYEIDIRHWQEISRRPLAGRASSPRL
jgi:hypothetical protein